MITCQQYDYIEIACMYQFPVILTLNTGETIKGVAKNTKRNELGEECIQLLVDDKNVLIVLDTITKLKVSVANPHFSEVILHKE
ncbi:Rho-binding antiterminator [Sulfurimonas sp.]|uniref:Rho-binding antiterminator n=1 Tax=Sulfurimonas sp. TaxID=2022749 RepID=UPI00261EB1EB|nr:Rho-binding antiterminator [Sulfurimonas sp.]